VEAPLHATSRMVAEQGGFAGYLRLVSGPPGTSLDRLFSGPGAPPRVDLALLRCQPVLGSPPEQAQRLLERLSPGGALVVVGYTDQQLAAVRGVVSALRPEYVWVDMADAQHTALVIAARQAGQLDAPLPAATAGRSGKAPAL
jgi:hypothetical protein